MADPLEQQKEELNLYRELTSLQSKLMKTGPERLNLESEISAQYVRQLANANKQSGSIKQMMILEASRGSITQKLLVLREAERKGIGNIASIQADIVTSMDSERRILIDIYKLEHQITQEKNSQALADEILTKLGLGKLVTLRKSIEEMANKSPWLVIASGIGVIFKSVFDTFKLMDQAAADFRKTIGATREGTARIESDARGIAFELAHVGVSAKDAYDSYVAMGNSIGTTQAMTKDLAENTALFQAQLGIAQSTSVDFTKTMGMISGQTMDSQKNMALFTQQMTEAGGVPLGAVMTDVAEASKTSYRFLSQSPLALAKAAVEARRMGTSLSAAAGSAEKLIEFTSSVKAEMEASVLLGQNLNLQKARELAYNKNISGLNKEILKLAKEVNFNQLDPFQQKAFAIALGKTEGEIAQILQAEKERRAIEVAAAKDPNGLGKQLSRYKDMEKATAEIAKNNATDAGNLLRVRSNQAAITAVSQAWHAIVQRISEKFLPAIAATLEFIAKMLGYLNQGWVAWVGAIIVAGALLTGVTIGVAKLLALLTGPLLGSAGMGIATLLMGLSTGLTALAAAAPGAGILIAIILSLSVAAVALGFAIKMIMDSLPKAAQGFSTFVDAIGKMSFKDIGKLYLLSGAMALMLPVLLPFSVGAAAAGAGFMLLGLGLNSVVSGLKALKDISFFNLIKQTVSLSVALSQLSDVISNIPQVNIDKVKAIGSVDIRAKEAGAVTAPAAASDNSDRILAELKALRQDLLSGGIKANVTVGASGFVSAISREYDRQGPIGPGVRKAVGKQ